MRVLKKDFEKRKENIKKIEIDYLENVLLKIPYLTTLNKQRLSEYFFKNRKNLLEYTTKNICLKSGLEKSIITNFKISRHVFKQQAWKGSLPGIKKASW